MTFTEAIKNGMLDELEKIAGFSRIGKRPFKAVTLLKKGTMSKLSAKVPAKAVKSGGKGLKTLALLGTGAMGYDQLQKAHSDWRTGRAIRKGQPY